MPTIVFLDLDNTFWTDDGVPDTALEAVRRAQAKGHLVFSNTGRTRGGCRPLRRYELDGYCYGAGTEAYLGGERIVDSPLGIEASRELCSLLDVGEGIIIAEGSERCFVHAYDQAKYDEIYERCAKVDDPYIDWPDIATMSDDDHAQVYKYTLWAPDEILDDMQHRLPADITQTVMGVAADYTQTRHSKATILDTVRTTIGKLKGMDYETVAFGDSGNDIPMLHAADTSVAMGNATDDAKAIADYVAPDILDDGLLHGFEQIGLI